MCITSVFFELKRTCPSGCYGANEKSTRSREIDAKGELGMIRGRGDAGAITSFCFLVMVGGQAVAGFLGSPPSDSNWIGMT
jgi:hypothetical protein